MSDLEGFVDEGVRLRVGEVGLQGVRVAYMNVGRSHVATHEFLEEFAPVVLD